MAGKYRRFVRRRQPGPWRGSPPREASWWPTAHEGLFRTRWPLPLAAARSRQRRHGVRRFRGRRPTKAGRSPATPSARARRTGPKRASKPVTGFAGHGLVNTFHRRRRPAGNRHVQDVSHRAAIHRLSDRRREQSGRNVHQLCASAESRPHGHGQGPRSPGAGRVGMSASSKASRRRSKSSTTAPQAWGHINVDQIIFSEISARAAADEGHGGRDRGEALSISFSSRGRGDTRGGRRPGIVVNPDSPAGLKQSAAEWKSRRVIRDWSASVTARTATRRCVDHGRRRSAGDRRPVGQRADLLALRRGCRGVGGAS